MSFVDRIKKAATPVINAGAKTMLKVRLRRQKSVFVLFEIDVLAGDL